MLGRHRMFKRLTRCLSTEANVNFIAQRLNSRCILKVAGDTATDYLQGLVTNDMGHLLNGTTGMYAMFLNTKGRVLYDSIIFKSNVVNEFLIECDSTAALSLKKHLNMYKVRRKISIENSDYEIWNVLHKTTLTDILDGAANLESIIAANKPIAMALKSIKDVIVMADPRTAALGIRVIAPKDAGSRLTANVTTNGTYYESLRYVLGIGEGVKELPTEKCFPLEANCDYLHGVSFHKGCYIGQELTARTHHTGVVRKRHMPLIFEEDASSLESDCLISSNTTEKSLGKLLGISGKFGLALLRVDEVLNAQNLNANGKVFKTGRPFWWPTEAPKERVRSI